MTLEAIARAAWCGCRFAPNEIKERVRDATIRWAVETAAVKRVGGRDPLSRKSVRRVVQMILDDFYPPIEAHQ